MVLVALLYPLLSAIFALGVQSPNDSGLCPSNKPINIKAPYDNIWKPLTEEETLGVQEWLYDQKGLNLTHFTEGGLR